MAGMNGDWLVLEMNDRLRFGIWGFGDFGRRLSA